MKQPTVPPAAATSGADMKRGCWIKATDKDINSFKPVRWSLRHGYQKWRPARARRGGRK